MASLNRVLIMGNLGQDPELRYTQSQTPVCTLNIATTDYRQGPDGQRQELTEWHRVVVWSKQAENCAKYLAKGRSVFVEGRLQTRSWEDKQGQKRYITEIVAQNVQFIGSGGAQRDRSPGQEHEFGAGQGGGGQGAGRSYGQSSGGAGRQQQRQNDNYDDMMSGGDAGGFGGPDTPGLDDIPF